MTQMQYLQIFADKEKLLEPFDDAERGRLLTAMMKYALHCEEIPLTGNERFIWPVFKQMIDQSREVLDNKRKAGISRQHKATDGSSAQQTAADDSASEQTAAKGDIKQESRIKNQDIRININNNGGIGKPRGARFSPPTPEAVSEYAQDAGITIDAQQFVDFYAAKGWKVGSAPMKDWQAAARNWARRDAKDARPPNTIKRVGAQQYTQRTYTENELADDVTNEILREAKGK